MEEKQNLGDQDVIDDQPQEETEEEQSLRIAREEKSAANCARVAFSLPVVKDIVSPHSSSILAKDGVVVELTTKMESAARESFAAIATLRPVVAEGEGEVGQGADSEPPVLEIPATVQVLSKLLSQIEATPFVDGGDLLDASVKRLLSSTRQPEGVMSMTEEEFLEFVRKWYNPPFYYGERARKLVGRGCLEDCLDIFTRGCNVNTSDGEGTSSLHYCAEFNRVDIIRALSDAFGGALMLNPKDKQGWTPLHNAVHFGNIECVQELLARGASVNSINIVGKSALHSAAAQGRVDICQLLLEHGGNPALGDSTGMTPLHEAAYKDQQQVYEILCQAQGADPQAKDKLGNTAKDYLGEYREDSGGAIAKGLENQSLPTPPQQQQQQQASGPASVRSGISTSSNKSKK